MNKITSNLSSIIENPSNKNNTINIRIKQRHKHKDKNNQLPHDTEIY